MRRWHLVRKELQQARRRRGAIASSLILPALLLLVIPLALALALSVRPPGSSPEIPLAAMRVLPAFLIPALVVVCGLAVAYGATIHAILSERERRTLDLLFALPVTLDDLIAAKVLANAAVACAVALPLFAVEAGAFLAIGVGDVGQWAAFAVCLVAAISCSVSTGLFFSLATRDYSAASNLCGLALATIMVGAGALIASAGLAGVLMTAFVCLFVAVAAFGLARRLATPERYLI